MTGTYGVVPVTCALPAQRSSIGNKLSLSYNFFLFNFVIFFKFYFLIFFGLNLFIIRPFSSDQIDFIRDSNKMSKGN